ncbi:MAG: phosphonate metabolism protein PhnP [Planctomycetes bacterium]|nr:phosphonate metabolism protein PhnP [Planctomycetota bacterium]
MKITLLGTGSAAGVPVWGCDCPACVAAGLDKRRRRRVTCATVEGSRGRLLIDGGVPDLAERLAPRDISALLVTHFHIDHVLGLFALRWSKASPIPAFAPPDLEGCADLFKHPGPFEFRRPPAFERFEIAGLGVTPVPLTHSKPTFGYCIDDGRARLAYLTDTKGLPADTAKFVAGFKPDLLVLDCSYPPREAPPRNHNDLPLAAECIAQVRPQRTLLVHISHELEAWLMEHPAMPPNSGLASDGETIDL